MGLPEREAFLPFYPSMDNTGLNANYGNIIPGVTFDSPVYTDEGIARMQQVLVNSQEIRDLDFGNVKGIQEKTDFVDSQHPFVNPASYDQLLKAALNKNKDVPQQLGITPDKYTSPWNWWWIVIAAVIAYFIFKRS